MGRHLGMRFPLLFSVLHAAPNAGARSSFSQVGPGIRFPPFFLPFWAFRIWVFSSLLLIRNFLFLVPAEHQLYFRIVYGQGPPELNVLSPPREVRLRLF